MSGNEISSINNNVAIKNQKIEGKEKTTKTTTIPMTQKKEAPEVTKEPTSGTYAATKINSIEIKIQEKKVALMKATPEERKEIETEITQLKEKKKLQDNTAVLEETDDGNVKFKMKKDMNVEKFKELFDIQDGILSNNKELDLQPEWKDVENDPTFHQVKDWSNCTIPKNKTFTLAPSNIDNQGVFIEMWNSLMN